jgi:hypothetical protein
MQFAIHIGPYSGSPGTALSAFKKVRDRQELNFGWATVTLLCDPTDLLRHLALDPHAKRWLGWTGTWFHPDAPGGTAKELLHVLRTRSIEVVARELEGFFAIFIGDDIGQRVHVITDRCGSCHVFSVKTSCGNLISSSSVALAAVSSRQLDPTGLHQFLHTGIIYGERTLWADVTKLPPASIYTFTNVRFSAASYWSFADVRSERLDLPEAVEALGAALKSAASRIGKRFTRPVCDVTGGYDSRACLTGFLSAGVAVDATVSGPNESADVRISKEIAERFGLRHIQTEKLMSSSIDELWCATRLTDGEFDVFDYSRIRATHLQLSADHDISLNGSFGELARGYWWELLFPWIGRKKPVDLSRIVRARLAPSAFDGSIFGPPGQIDLREHIENVAGEAIRGLEQFPNTTQLDSIYFTLRMQRWQGRIASATHQIWPCLSPLSMHSVLTPMLEARARARMGSRLIREMIHRLQPELSAINLEHGYPAQPLQASNVTRFLPVLRNYGGRAIAKSARVLSAHLSRHTGVRGVTRGTAPPLSNCSGELAEMLSQPLLAESGLFKEDALRRALDSRVSSIANPRWRRLVTLELVLRELTRVRQSTAESRSERKGSSLAAA